MSWAALAAKNKAAPVPESKPQIVRAPGGYDGAAAVKAVAPVEEDAPVAQAPAENAPTRRVLVIDTGGLIRGANGLAEKSDEFATIPQVMQEVRDRKTRDFVEKFPFEVQKLEPTKESMKEVIRVAKLTGDFGTLSAVDMRVIGLAHTMAVQRNALRPPTEAQKAGGEAKMSVKNIKVNTARTPHGDKKQAGTDLPGWGSWEEDDEGEEDEEAEEQEEPEESQKAEGGEAETEEKVDGVIRGKTGDEVEVKEETVEVDGGWITPANIKDFRGEGSKFGEGDDGRTVGCLTTDFAMQNVLMHLGVLVISVEGYRVKHLKRWVLRCHGCYCIVKDTTRQFCPDCGSGDTLKRVSYSVNEHGEEEIWINPRRRINIRGTVYNLPKPRGGRGGTNKSYVIREDMLMNCGRTKKLEDKQADRVAAMLSDDWMFAANHRDGKRKQHVASATSSYSTKNPNRGRKRKL